MAEHFLRKHRLFASRDRRAFIKRGSVYGDVEPPVFLFQRGGRLKRAFGHHLDFAKGTDCPNPVCDHNGGI